MDDPRHCPIFVGGVPRSGTTLLRVILDTHPRIHCGPEARVVRALAVLSQTVQQHGGAALQHAYGVSPNEIRAVFAELILAFLEPGRRASGKPRGAEKTPSNLFAFQQLATLFPDSPLVHVIRDGRDVVASRLERDRAAGVTTSADVVRVARIRATEWAEAMRLRRALLEDPAASRNYVEIRYENLISDPERTLRVLFGRIGESYDPRVLAYHAVEREVQGVEEWSADSVRRPLFATSVGRWRQALSTEELHAVHEAAGEELTRLGYTGPSGTA